MKKLILTVAMVAAVSVGAFAQGTISFQNAVGGVGGRITTNNGTSSGLAQGTYTVQILYGTTGTTLANLTPGAIFTSSTGSGLFFDGSTLTLTGITAGSGSADTQNNVSIAILGWTGNFASYAAAVAGGAFVGETAVFNNPTGGGGTPAAAAANLVNWLAANNLVLTPVPEPSTIALGGLGAAALLLFRRKK